LKQAVLLQYSLRGQAASYAKGSAAKGHEIGAYWNIIIKNGRFIAINSKSIFLQP
jgi:hypothetical protein